MIMRNRGISFSQLLAWIGFIALLVSLCPGTQNSAYAAERAGVSAAVRGQVLLSRGGEQVVGRRIESGEDVFLRDKLESHEDSGMQLMLLDETVFTIGADSSIVIDEFIYDPNSDAAELTAEVLKGVVRFVSGKVATKGPDRMNVELPVGNLGIRGTIVMVDARVRSRVLAVLIGPGDRNDMNQRVGSFEACNEGVCRRIESPGWGAELVRGQPPKTVRVDLDRISQIASAIEDPKGSKADSTTADSDDEGEDGDSSDSTSAEADSEAEDGDADESAEAEAATTEDEGDADESTDHEAETDTTADEGGTDEPADDEADAAADAGEAGESADTEADAAADDGDVDASADTEADTAAGQDDTEASTEAEPTADQGDASESAEVEPSAATAQGTPDSAKSKPDSAGDAEKTSTSPPADAGSTATVADASASTLVKDDSATATKNLSSPDRILEDSGTDGVATSDTFAPETGIGADAASSARAEMGGAGGGASDIDSWTSIPLLVDAGFGQVDTPDSVALVVAPQPFALEVGAVTQERVTNEAIATMMKLSGVEGFVEVQPNEGRFLEVGTAGLIRGQLVWSSPADLDLHMIAPDGQDISFGTPRAFFENAAIAENDIATNRDGRTFLLGPFSEAGATPEAFPFIEVPGGVDRLIPASSPGETQPTHIDNISTVPGTSPPEGLYTFFVQNFEGPTTSPTLTITGDGGTTSYETILPPLEGGDVIFQSPDSLAFESNGEASKSFGVMFQGEETDPQYLAPEPDALGQ